jgi:hypothetical protein
MEAYARQIRAFSPGGDAWRKAHAAEMTSTFWKDDMQPRQVGEKVCLPSIHVH